MRARMGPSSRFHATSRCGPVGMGAGPGHGDEAAVRVAEEVEALEAEVLADRLDVGDVLLEVVVGRIGRPVGAAGTSAWR